MSINWYWRNSLQPAPFALFRVAPLGNWRQRHVAEVSRLGGTRSLADRRPGDGDASSRGDPDRS
jgi:hypothetical protein